MKKVLCISLLCLLIFTGCQKSNNDQIQAVIDQSQGQEGFSFNKGHKKIDVDMKEKIYAAVFEDIMVNTEKYLGETIKLEGMYTEYAYDDGSRYNYVYRYGPGCPCCGDGFYGIEFVWDGELPKENDWIEVVGVLDEYTEDGFSFLTLQSLSVKVLDKRGEESVTY